MTNLTVHKNTLEKRRRKQLRDSLIDTTKFLAKQSGVSSKLSGYLVMGWDDNQDAIAYWACGDVNTSLLGEYAKQTINRTITKLDTIEVITGKGTL